MDLTPRTIASPRRAELKKTISVQGKTVASVAITKMGVTAVTVDPNEEGTPEKDRKPLRRSPRILIECTAYDAKGAKIKTKEFTCASHPVGDPPANETNVDFLHTAMAGHARISKEQAVERFPANVWGTV
jgi:hypothetical protein